MPRKLLASLFVPNLLVQPQNSDRNQLAKYDKNTVPPQNKSIISPNPQNKKLKQPISPPSTVSTSTAQPPKRTHSDIDPSSFSDNSDRENELDLLKKDNLEIKNSNIAQQKLIEQIVLSVQSIAKQINEMSENSKESNQASQDQENQEEYEDMEEEIDNY